MATSKLRKSLQSKLRRMKDWHTDNSKYVLSIKKDHNTSSVTFTLPAFSYYKTPDDRRIGIRLASSDGSKSLVSYISVKEMNILCKIMNEFCREMDEHGYGPKESKK